ncbi:MAG: hypothetical protein AB8B73_07635 [Ekhidna sp.]
MYKKEKVSTALMLLIATLSFGQTNSVDKEDGIKYKGMDIIGVKKPDIATEDLLNKEKQKHNKK